MPNLGLVALDKHARWIGGRYYLHHCVRMLAATNAEHGWSARDVWWGDAPETDPFAEVRGLLTGQTVLRFPSSALGRLSRRIRRWSGRVKGVADLFRQAGIDVLFPIVPCAQPGIPLVFWIADLQYLQLPDMFDAPTRQALDEHNRTGVEQAAHVVVSSESGLKDFVARFPEAKNRVSVVPFAVVPDASWRARDPEEVRLRYALPERVVLIANQFSHHKNHETVFEAVRRLRDRGTRIDVACTGSTWGWRGPDYMAGLLRFLDAESLRDRVHILGLIPREDQIALARRAVAVVQPSRFEGWSSSVEEAQTLGRPLIVSNLDVHREQTAGRSVVSVEPDDVEAWASAMSAAIDGGTPGPDEHAEHFGEAWAQERLRHFGRRFFAALDTARRAES
jgi:glycosyltransferase involved in cell wall biosynthesis